MCTVKIVLIALVSFAALGMASSTTHTFDLGKLVEKPSLDSITIAAFPVSERENFDSPLEQREGAKIVLGDGLESEVGPAADYWNRCLTNVSSAMHTAVIVKYNANIQNYWLEHRFVLTFESGRLPEGTEYGSAVTIALLAAVIGEPLGDSVFEGDITADGSSISQQTIIMPVIMPVANRSFFSEL